jgi:sigma-B regulation protein RsbU (phosphoserine phosphatase)
MPKALESGSPRAAWWKPPTGIAGAVFWLAVVFGLLWLLRRVHATNGPLVALLQLLVGVALIVLAFPLAWKLIRTRLLWSLRSKLILTYLLIGLAPAVLFLTLAGVLAYIAAGTFSIHLADTRLHQELDAMGVDSASRASRASFILRARDEGMLGPPRPPAGLSAARRPAGRPGPTTTQETAPPVPATNPEASAQATPLAESLPDPLRARLHHHTSVFINGAAASNLSGFGGGPPPGPRDATTQPTPLGLPPWAADLHGNEFHGLVRDGEDLYLVTIDQRRAGSNGDLVSAVTSMPVDSALMDVVAQDLGRVHIVGFIPGNTHAASADAPPRTAVPAAGRGLSKEFRGTSVYGGTEPSPINFGDIRVSFPSTLDTIDWDTGLPDKFGSTVVVHSRPSLLYHQLFGSSLGGIVTDVIRNGLIILCVLFGLIEALALWMAWRLFRALTASVHEIYEATQRVDRGDFVHRIAASAISEKDQLGELALSFNRMTGSLERLLVEQKEKERLQSELAIAQEVQANLFPHRARDLPTLELHGICRPARTVSGDYYDFLVFHHQDKDGHHQDNNGHQDKDENSLSSGEYHTEGEAHLNGATNGRESGVGIVLGDISGKGISAALLMATLHSAVRAYRFASEDLVYSESSFAGLTVSREALAGDSGKLFESPGRILSLLNRHLYRSTQPEKYATLFLAHYDAATAQLTYSNAGHLPPLVLGRDGKIRRLDCGGTVVGLMDGMRYEEGHIQMTSGDILVAYSDGVTEPENDFGDFGEARLMEVVARYRDEPLHVISAQVMLALDAWIGAAEQPDDITLVLARQV